MARDEQNILLHAVLWWWQGCRTSGEIIFLDNISNYISKSDRRSYPTSNQEQVFDRGIQSQRYDRDSSWNKERDYGSP